VSGVTDSTVTVTVLFELVQAGTIILINLLVIDLIKVFLEQITTDILVESDGNPLPVIPITYPPLLPPLDKVRPLTTRGIVKGDTTGEVDSPAIPRLLITTKGVTLPATRLALPSPFVDNVHVKELMEPTRLVQARPPTETDTALRANILF
jgi:hypothetical protein